MVLGCGVPDFFYCSGCDETTGELVVCFCWICVSAPNGSRKPCVPTLRRQVARARTTRRDSDPSISVTRALSTSRRNRLRFAAMYFGGGDVFLHLCVASPAN